jgi:branched-chain amino acid transport system permease protein
MGAVSASILAILLVAAPASQATSPAPTPSPSNQTFQNNISGFLRDDTRAPLADVTITAKKDGFTGTAKSSANGSWNIGVPDQGTYTVELDESTLPVGF